MATYVKVAGTWREVTSDSPSDGVCGYVRVNRIWRTVNQSYVRINGVWRSTCTAPGQQPAPILEDLCFRPNYCNNGTDGVILPTTEPCLLADGVTIGSRIAAYTCQTDPGCVTFTVPAGTCTVPDPIIQVVSEEIGDCENFGGISGCTNGFAKRVTKRYSDSSLKVSYSCCNPLTPNLKYYCTLRPFTTGTCLNELKDIDFTGVVVTGQGEWVCEELGSISYPSCSTTENCTVPKSTSVASESCGYLGTGQRTVTSNTYQSWCEVTQDTVIGDCVGADDPCGGKYCGSGSGEEEYPTSTCASGTGVRYKCVTPEGCDVIYTFRRCTSVPPPPPPPPGPGPITTVYQVTEVCLEGPNTTRVASCRQYSTTDPQEPSGAFCYNQLSTNGVFPACPDDSPITDEPGGNCSTCEFSYSLACTTAFGEPGQESVCVTPAGCEDIYGNCVATPGGCNSCIDNITLDCDCPGGLTGTFNLCTTPGDCPNIESPCNCPTTGGGTEPDCSDCFFGSGTQDCGFGGTQTYCITPVGCPNIYGPCLGDPVEETPEEPDPVEPTPEEPIFPPGTCFIWCDGEPIGGGTGKSININTLVRTKDGLVAAHDLKVGDKLISADIESFPYDNLTATNMDLISWGAENPYVNLVETEIVSLRTRISKWAVVVDSDIFSDTHYLLVKRGDTTSFVKALDLEHTDLIWSYSERNWISISVLEKVDVNHEVVSIDCEPYDIFFTERMLTHDSNTVD